MHHFFIKTVLMYAQSVMRLQFLLILRLVQNVSIAVLSLFLQI
ncbi:hypothetical protein DWUX_1485 [Desulfovibrio diazotrophicus]|nr:hypothetical protein DWUX_1485 [Desulfovibrio diazotrophicus]